MSREKETKFGFTEGDPVEVTSDSEFKGCVSNISMFDGQYVVLYFTHPPEGHNPTSGRFLPDHLQQVVTHAIPEAKDV